MNADGVPFRPLASRLPFPTRSLALQRSHAVQHWSFVFISGILADENGPRLAALALSEGGMPVLTPKGFLFGGQRLQFSPETEVGRSVNQNAQPARKVHGSDDPVAGKISDAVLCSFSKGISPVLSQKPSDISMRRRLEAIDRPFSSLAFRLSRTMHPRVWLGLLTTSLDALMVA